MRSAKGNTSSLRMENLRLCRSRALAPSRSISFVPRNEIDDRYIDSPYYLAPAGQAGQDACAFIRDTIAKMNMVALGRVVLTRREHVIALEARGLGLLGLTLRYPL